METSTPSPPAGSQSIPPQAEMLQLITGYWTSQMILVVTKLGIPDLLADGPKTAQELACSRQLLVLGSTPGKEGVEISSGTPGPW